MFGVGVTSWEHQGGVVVSFIEPDTPPAPPPQPKKKQGPLCMAIIGPCLVFVWEWAGGSTELFESLSKGRRDAMPPMVIRGEHSEWQLLSSEEIYAALYSILVAFVYRTVGICAWILERASKADHDMIRFCFPDENRSVFGRHFSVGW